MEQKKRSLSQKDTLTHRHFSHRPFHTQIPVYIDTFTDTDTHTLTHKPFYTETLLHTDTHTHIFFLLHALSDLIIQSPMNKKRSPFHDLQSNKPEPRQSRSGRPQTLVRRDRLTHRAFCTETLLQTAHKNTSKRIPFTDRPFYTQSLHRDAFTYRPLCIQTFVETNSFRLRPFYAQTLVHTNTFTRRPLYTRTL